MTKAEFLTKVANYEASPKEWKFLGDKPCIVDFYASWCGPCKMMAPVVEEIAEETEGQVLVCKLNVDQAMDIAQKYKVVSIPTFLIFKGGQLTDRVIGATDKEDLLEKLK